MFFKKLKCGLQNFVEWYKTIWNDRNWSHYYLYKIMLVKLKKMEQYHQKYNHNSESKTIVNQIKTCIRLLERIIDDQYLIKPFKTHAKKWGLDDFNRPKNIDTPENIQQEYEERLLIYKQAENSREQDLDMLFKFLRTYSENWWD